MAAVLCAFVIYILLPGDTSAITDKESCGSFFEVQDGELETYERVRFSFHCVTVVSPSHSPEDPYALSIKRRHRALCHDQSNLPS